MIVGIGTDIVETSRFERFVREGNDRILDRLFTPRERSYCEGKGRPALHYAARFAAKEALFKALGSGLRGGMSWHDPEVVNDPEGAPSFRMAGVTAERCRQRGVGRIHLSLAHESGHAVAMVVLESGGEP